MQLHKFQFSLGFICAPLLREEFINYFLVLIKCISLFFGLSVFFGYNFFEKVVFNGINFLPYLDNMLMRSCLFVILCCTFIVSSCLLWRKYLRLTISVELFIYLQHNKLKLFFEGRTGNYVIGWKYWDMFFFVVVSLRVPHYYLHKKKRKEKKRDNSIILCNLILWCWSALDSELKKKYKTKLMQRVWHRMLTRIWCDADFDLSILTEFNRYIFIHNISPSNNFALYFK